MWQKGDADSRAPWNGAVPSLIGGRGEEAGEFFLPIIGRARSRPG